MITRGDIRTFLDNENSQKRKEMKEYYALPLEERIQKRKCIGPVYYDESYATEWHPEYNYRYRFTFEYNSSDLKVGDYVLLSRDNPGAFCHVLNIGDPIVEIGDDYIILSSKASSIVSDTKVSFTLDACYFDSTEINSRFLVADSERKEKWLKVINDVPKLEFNQTENLDKLINSISTSLNIELTTSQYRAIYEAVTNKEYSLIQGPPGTGKTFIIAIITYILLCYGNKVIVSSSNHLAINNVLCKIHQTLALIQDLNPLDFKREPTKEGECPVNTLNRAIFKVGRTNQTSGLNYKFKGEDITVANIPWPNVSAFVSNNEDSINMWVIGITPQTLYTRAAGLEADVVILDEAGQLTIPHALMAMQKADYAILVGDHKQLPPITTYKEHLDELKKSIFQTLYRDYNCVTLDKSYRMNGQICQLISDSFYDGQLESVCKERCLASYDEDAYLVNKQSVLFKDIKHEGTCTSEEEADYIVSAIKAYVEQFDVKADDIAVLAPFRAQCSLLKRKLYKELKELIPIVDTIDRMQGQERDIIFYSFTTGDEKYAAGLVEFLYNPNKINVAASRARCKLILVGNKSCIRSVINNSDQNENFTSVLKLLESNIVQMI